MNHRRFQKGFSLVELTIVVVILGIIAMMGVPKYRAVVERAKATEGLTYLHQIETQQAGFQAWKGRYARTHKELSSFAGSGLARPMHFAISEFNSYDWETLWSVRVKRIGASSGFGEYTISWDQNGFNASRSSIPTKLKPDGGGTAPISSGGGSATPRESGESGGGAKKEESSSSDPKKKEDTDKEKKAQKAEKNGHDDNKGKMDERDRGEEKAKSQKEEKGKEKSKGKDDKKKKDDDKKGKKESKEKSNNRDSGRGKKKGHDD